MSKNNQRKPSQVETVEEYVARGGSIQRIPEATRESIPDLVKKTATGGPAVFLSLDEADLFYGEARKGAKPKKTKPLLKIDINALPPALKNKFITKLKEEADGEGYEEELERISDDDSDDGDED